MNNNKQQQQPITTKRKKRDREKETKNWDHRDEERWQ